MTAGAVRDTVGGLGCRGCVHGLTMPLFVGRRVNVAAFPVWHRVARGAVGEQRRDLRPCQEWNNPFLIIAIIS